MSCPRHHQHCRQLGHRHAPGWGIFKWPQVEEFGWPPGPDFVLLLLCIENGNGIAIRDSNNEVGQNVPCVSMEAYQRTRERKTAKDEHGCE